MQMEQILKLVDTVSNSTLSSFQYEENGSCLILQQQIKKVTGEQSKENMNTTSVEQQVLTIDPAKPDSEEKEGSVVVSPLVGVFYAQPTVGAKPYIQVGDTVRKGQVIGIIEAMKLMNEVEATCDGTVLEILVENEQIVEYGQEIVRIG